ncbi:peptidoglycan-binding protein [uncultured Cohaesibacter sp.]|uniref:peptidoglycan-binding protein n=1 Tax=uncultured Cohaesibacter sp. TaxID=1002546 RepID=UPI0029C75767|nr:peptidoglycan-binding protein [uncultured Cohaesibacter sp.]
MTNKVRQFVSSGDANQAVSDDGLFRELFLDAINGKDPRADMNGDGYILGSELGLYLDQRVSNLTGNSQTPRFGKLRAHGFDLGDFVFKVPSQSISPEPQEREVKTEDAVPTPAPTSIANQELLERIAKLEKLLQAQQLDNKTPPQLTPAPEAPVPSKSPDTSSEQPTETSGTTGEEESPSSSEPDATIDKQLDAFFDAKEKFGRGDITKDEMVKASLFLNDASMSGDDKAQQELGVCYWDASCGFEKDEQKAVRLIRMAAENGNAQAQADIGWMYYNGNGGYAVDIGKAAEWYKPAAEKGIASAQNTLGYIYQYGKGGVAVDEEEAVRLYRLAAEQDEPNALNNLGYMYSFGKGGLPKDLKEAARYYRMAADLGHTIAQWELANFYFDGTGGLEKDQAEAARLYRLAADKGDATALNDLGYMYRKGLGGLPMDENEAERLYKLAAEQNQSVAMYNLAHLYEYGSATKRDPKAAAQYFLKALKLREQRTVDLLINKQGEQLSALTRRHIQELLRDEGYYSGSIDAKFGSGTKSALLTYQN